MMDRKDHILEHNSNKKQIPITPDLKEKSQLISSPRLDPFTSSMQNMKRPTCENGNHVPTIQSKKLHKKSSDESMPYSKNIDLHQTSERLWRKHNEGKLFSFKILHVLFTQ